MTALSRTVARRNVIGLALEILLAGAAAILGPLGAGVLGQILGRRQTGAMDADQRQCDLIGRARTLQRPCQNEFLVHGRFRKDRIGQKPLLIADADFFR